METDLHLLSRYHRHGDAEAFQTLVESHAGMVHATAARVTRDAMLAQDVAQETFLALARSGGAAIQCVGAWLHHVAWQKARDKVRGESRRRNYEAAAAGQMQEEPGAEATWAEVEPLLDEALDELPAEARSVLIARFFEGRTQQEIAQRQGISQSTVSRTLEQGIAGLRSKLKARGVACGAGLAGLLAANGVQAAPPALVVTLAKLALSGVGTTTAALTFTQIIISILMTPTAKITLVAAAVLAAAALGLHEASSDSSNPISKSPAEGATVPAADQNQTTASSTVTATHRPAAVVAAASTISPSNGAPGPAGRASQTFKAPSPEILAKLSSVLKEADFKAFLLRVYSLRDPELMAAEIQRTLGLSIPAKDLEGRVANPSYLEVSIFGNMAMRHPEEMLAWMAMYEGDTRFMSEAALKMMLKQYPHLTAESIEATLPAGPNRETLMSVLRAQRDPFSEAARAISEVRDERARQDRLWQIANHWPKDKLAEGANWALENLTGRDLQTLLPRVAGYLSNESPDDTIALLARIADPDLLGKTLNESIYAFVHKHQRMEDIVPVIGRLQGKQRASSIAELANRWVRVDQEGLIEWINRLDTPADFEAAVPATLPQLSPENYTKAMDQLMTQRDGKVEAALIKAATPDMSNSTRNTVDIVQRLTGLPQYRSIGSGQSGNADLLWEAVNRIAEGWVKRQGGRAQDGAQWIDGLRFRTPADKAKVAGKLYQQWAISDRSAAAQWAARAGVAVR